jgi:hypothetical protein
VLDHLRFRVLEVVSTVEFSRYVQEVRPPGNTYLIRVREPKLSHDLEAPLLENRASLSGREVGFPPNGEPSAADENAPLQVVEDRPGVDRANAAWHAGNSSGRLYYEHPSCSAERVPFFVCATRRQFATERLECRCTLLRRGDGVIRQCKLDCHQSR